MTCLTQHLTAFGVQEYTGAIVAPTAAAVDAQAEAALEAASKMLAILTSWAVWLSVALLLVMIFALLWGYRKDNHDELNYETVAGDKRRLYVGLCLDPIEPTGDRQQEQAKSQIVITT